MEHFVPLDRMPAGVAFPPDLAEKFCYDADSRRLIFRGFMSKAEFDRLTMLSEDWPYRRALDDLFRASTEDDSPRSRGRIGSLLNSLRLF